MGKSKTEFKCINCESVFPKWQGRCPTCNEWGSIEEVEKKISINETMRTRSSHTNEKPVSLKTLQVNIDQRIQTTNEELNRVLGGGIVRDSVNVLSAPPGMGKSTLLMQLANDLGMQGSRVLYVSGEESVFQIKGRADRICTTGISEQVMVVSETSLNQIQQYIEEINPQLIIIDSIQTIYLEEIASRPGSPTQINECTHKIIEIAKSTVNPKAFFLTSQMNKDDEMAGTRVFEHLVDAVMYLEGDRFEQLRLLKSVKNRFGDTSETGIFQMTEDGMIAVSNPSTFFMTERETSVTGSSLTVTREGTRTLIVEVESLVSHSYFGFPARMANGIRKDLLQILVEILEQRGNVSCNDKNVTVMITGGLRLIEPSVNLGIIMSIASSVYKQPIPDKTVFVGEVGLTGEIKKVPQLEARIKEVDRMGFSTIYVPRGNLQKRIDTKQVNVVEVANLKEAIQKTFSSISSEDKNK